MFKVVAERRERRFWSSRTAVASVAFHLLLLAGFVAAAETADKPVEKVEIIDLDPLPPEKPRPVRVDPAPPVQPDKPPPVKGATVQLPAPERVPTTIPEPDPRATPITAAMVTGVGPIGEVIGPPDPDPRPLTGSTEPQPPLPSWEAPIDAREADTQPELANKRQAEMALQRAYPPRLRDVGVAGHTTVMLIIDKDGNVEPGSVRVQESTHSAFEDAAVRAVERFRFKPATLRGRPISVLVTLPIAWQLEN
ncbi:MAG TPA: TonB family protein [Longimicrobium sp.]|nr:TonB family protein [Longimicrobium sp.]